jgi:putative ABC transport system ATP-binding protein
VWCGLSAILVAEEVRKSYRMGAIVVEALRGVSLEIRRGEFTAIFGPSGSGKSTLLNILSGLDRPDEGKVLVNGTDISTLSPDELAETRLRQIGFVFQSFSLLPSLSVLRNVELPLALADVAEAKSLRRAESILALVGLEKRLHHHPTELSGGEQQRVAIARALINEPDIVFADEPTGNLDTSTGLRIVDLMRRLNKEKSQTFLVVTHDQNVAKASDHILYLEDGEIKRFKENV